LALALAEVAEFGGFVAETAVANARALAAALESEGFEVIARERGYTSTYQIFLNLGDRAQDFERRCQAANILVSDCALSGSYAWTSRTGARLATHELTRIGMGAPEMAQIARLIRRAVHDKEDPARLAREVQDLLARYPRISCSFD
jgi:glycine hydroxymethyltransferase